MADLLTQPDLTAMTEHATLLLDSLVQKYQLSTGPQHMRGGYASHRWRRILAGLYLPVRIRRNFRILQQVARQEAKTRCCDLHVAKS